MSFTLGASLSINLIYREKFYRRTLESNSLINVQYASINSSGAHPSPGNRGAFAYAVTPGGGAFANLSQPGGWALAYPGATPGAFDTRVFE